MPRYDYRCLTCGVFDAEGSRDARQTLCPEGHPAERLPFSGVPYLNGETVVSAIPDPVYRQDAERKQLHATWGTGERSIEMLRKSVIVDEQGRKSIDLQKMNGVVA